jgi:hypothetical protein
MDKKDPLRRWLTGLSDHSACPFSTVRDTSAPPETQIWMFDRDELAGEAGREILQETEGKPVQRIDSRAEPV